MNGYSAENKAAGYLLTAAAGCAGAYNLLFSFTSAETLEEQVLPMFLCCAAVLFFPCFFQKTERLAGVGIALLFLWGFSEAAGGDLRRETVEFLLREPGDGMFRLVGSAWGMPIVGAIFALAAFLCGKRQLAAVLFWVGNTVLSTVLFLMGYPVSVWALAAVTGCSALLFVWAGIKTAAEGKPGGGKAMLRAAALAALVVAGVLAGSQYAYNGLRSAFGDQEKIDLSETFSKIHKGLFVTSGFRDYDPNYVLGRKMQVDNTPVLLVHADGPVYLRGRIYDTYTGRSWQVGNDALANPMSRGDVTAAEAYYYNAALAYYVKDMNRQASDQTENFIQSDTPPYLLPDSPLRLCHITVTPETDGQKYLFLPGFLSGDPSVAVRRNYPGLELATPIPKGSVYRAQYLQPDFNNKAYQLVDRLDENKLGSRLLDQKKTAAAAMKSIFDSTDKVTPRTTALAEEITKGMTDERQKAAAISAWLQKNCSYTLSPPQPWFGQDFTDFFLFSSRKGYCQHFATAMVLLLRASGVPARYVEGYAVPSVSNYTEMNTFEVTNAQAHAWVEYYSARYGFITADPTPGSALPQPEILTEEGSSMAPARSAPSDPKPSSLPSVPKTSSAPGTVVSSAPGGGNSGGAAEMFLSFLRAAGVIVFALSAVFGAKTAYRALWFSFVKRKDGRKMPMMLYRYFVHVLFRLGFEMSASGTPNELADKVRGRISFDPVGFDRITELYCEVRYGGRTLNGSETEEWLQFYHTLPAACRRYLGTFRWFLFCGLL